MLVGGIQICSTVCVGTWKEGECPLSINHICVKPIPHAGMRSVQRDLNIRCAGAQRAGRMFSFSSANMVLLLLILSC